MGSLAQAARDNMVYRLETMSAHSSEVPAKEFARYSPVTFDPNANPDGAARTFRVLWDGEVLQEPTDIVERISLHTYQLRVNYPAMWDEDQLHDLMLKDRHDILKALRDPDNYLGTARDAPTAATGINSRWPDNGVKVERGDAIWTVVMDWFVTLFEQE